MAVNTPQKLSHKKPDILKRLLANYERSLLLPTSVLGENELRNNTKEFSERFGLRTEIRAGTLSLLENAWKELKKVAN